MIGFLIIATGNYYKFLPNLIKSIERFYPKNIDKKYYIFSNHKLQLDFVDNYEIIYFKHESFPSSTLFRFHQFSKIKNKLLSETDYVCYVDSDSIFVRPPPTDIFNKEFYGFEHGVNIINEVYDLPYERNLSSTSCVKCGQERRYIIGGLWGGLTRKAVEIFDNLQNNIDLDLKNNIIACFHDESHINKYFSTNPDCFIYDTKYILGEIDSYNNIKIWKSEDSLENCRNNFILKKEDDMIIEGEHFAIFLAKDHNKERTFLGADQEIILK